MPELPEVETVKRVLEKLVINKRIKSVEVFCDKMIKNVSVLEYKNKLENEQIKSIDRIGKYLLINLEKYTIVSHLRMEGKYNYYQENYKKDKHDYIIYYFVDGSVLAYNDTRKFGTIELVDIYQEKTLNSISKLGLEPFDENFNYNYVVEKTKRLKSTIKQVLLNQEIFLGIGNIYADEVLFASNVLPSRKVDTITKKEWEKIIENSKIILNQAIDDGGTSVHSFMVSGNIDGKFQNKLKVYHQHGKECQICKSKIEKTKIGGRGTHYCPKCQR